MNLNEFKKKKPDFVKEASKCKDKFEFTRVAEKFGIRFGADCFNKAYALFCNPRAGEISEDILEDVAGGANISTTEVLPGTTIMKVD